MRTASASSSSPTSCSTTQNPWSRNCAAWTSGMAGSRPSAAGTGASIGSFTSQTDNPTRSNPKKESSFELLGTSCTSS